MRCEPASFDDSKYPGRYWRRYYSPSNGTLSLGDGRLGFEAGLVQCCILRSKRENSETKDASQDSARQATCEHTIGESRSAGGISLCPGGSCHPFAVPLTRRDLVLAPFWSQPFSLRCLSLLLHRKEHKNIRTGTVWTLRSMHMDSTIHDKTLSELSPGVVFVCATEL